jgi:ubiquitin-like protein ATG12
MEEGTDAAISASSSSQPEGDRYQQQASIPGPTAPIPLQEAPADEALDTESALASLAIVSTTQEGAEAGGGRGTISAALDTSQDDTPPSTLDDNNSSTTVAASSQPSAPSTFPAVTNTGKVKVQLMAVGRAPRLAQSKFIVQAKDSFRALLPVLRRLLQLRDDQALFVFVNSAFAPAPEDKFGDLFNCFGKTGTLIVNYGLDEAWG